MKIVSLSTESVSQDYDAVSSLSPHIPSLSHWRAWEYAAYQHYRLDGCILDLGCADGRYFRLIWPQATDVLGVNMNSGVAELGRQSGGGEMRDAIFPFLSANANFPGAFRKVFTGLLEMETDWQDCSGAVFLVRKPR